jgi:hypothetical protein
MAITLMVATKKMLSWEYKIIFWVGSFLFLVSPFNTLAVNYGSGSYGSGYYSNTLPSAIIATPVANTYSTTQSISLSSSGSSSIRYSLTGTPASCSDGTLYANPISLSATGIIYVRACNSYSNSITDSFAYTISPNNSSGAILSVLQTKNNQLTTNTPLIATTQPTYNFGTKTLKNGSKGEAVMELQRFLNDKLNLGLVIDGKLGPKTIAVIKKWQKANGLVADGLVGAKTKAKMNSMAQ